MQWKSGCGHLVSHELQRGGGSTSIVGRAAGKKGIVTPSMCPAVRTPTDLVRENTDLYSAADVYPDVLWYRGVWRASDVL